MRAVPQLAVVMFAEPLKLVPLIVRAVWSVVAVNALPARAAVMVPAEKLPDASRATTFDAVFREVASTAIVGDQPSPAVPDTNMEFPAVAPAT